MCISVYNTEKKNNNNNKNDQSNKSNKKKGNISCSHNVYYHDVHNEWQSELRGELLFDGP